MPAAWGAAAEVPKKLGYFGLFWHSVIDVFNNPFGMPAEASVKPRKVSFPPSGPTKSGFCRTTGVVSRTPEVLNRMGVPPWEEKTSSVGGVFPHRGVWK